MIKISPSARSFPALQKQPPKHDTRGRSVFGLGRTDSADGRKRDIDSPSPPLHYLHKSWRRRRLRHVCCERHSDGARAHQLPCSLSERPATCHAVRPCIERRGNYVYLLWFVYPLSVRQPDVPHSLPFLCPSAFRMASSLLFRLQHGMWLRWSMRMWYRQKPFRKQLPPRRHRAPIRVTDGKTDNCEASPLLLSRSPVAINTPSTVRLIFASVAVDRRRNTNSAR